MKSTIKLFKAVPIKVKRKKKASDTLLEITISKGFIFSPEVVYNYSEKELTELVKRIEKEVGLTAEQMNASFHKSWKKVKEASCEQLVLEQIIHYITTYGFESLGIYDENTIFIPNEQLYLPDIKIDKVKLVVIKGYTKEELKEKLLKLLQTGIALGEDTITAVLDVALFVELTKEDVATIKNKEVRVLLYDHLGIFPENNIEFLRYLVYKATDKPFFIKDKTTIAGIKNKKNLDVLGLLNRYGSKYGLEKLAEIFYRFKPLWLAFKTNNKLNSIINKIRKLAKKYHKPMREDYLNEVTAKIKKDEIDVEKLKDELKRVNTFRKIRLAYSLQFRTTDVKSILYKVRNGKGYATEFEFNKKKESKGILDIVLDSIAKDVRKNVKGKKIYIPEYVNYTLPATEKQFVGEFPCGTCITIPKDMIFGVHWEDQERYYRIDLDLSLINATVGKIGWDRYYRSDDRKVLFSGDVTAAPKPKGASELFYVKKQIKQSFVLFLNYYNFDENIEVPFKIIVAKEQVKQFGRNYMVDPNNVVATVNSKINKPQKMLGLLVVTTKKSKFYFVEASLGASITSSDSEFAENARKYLFGFYKNAINLGDILERAGAKMVKDKEKCEIDLSPENLEKDTIINLVTNK